MTNFVNKLLLFKLSSKILIVPPNIDKTVVIFVSQVNIGLTLYPVMFVAYRLPYLVCPEGASSILWYQTAACGGEAKKSGNVE